jgi:hypothetical protein
MVFFINKKRTQDNLLNIIEKTYSKNHKIIIGDWSIGKQMRNFISTPNLTLKRKLKNDSKCLISTSLELRVCVIRRKKMREFTFEVQ